MCLREFISNSAPVLLRFYQCTKEFTSGDKLGIRTIWQSALGQATDSAITSAVFLRWARNEIQIVSRRI